MLQKADGRNNEKKDAIRSKNPCCDLRSLYLNLFSGIFFFALKTRQLYNCIVVIKASQTKLCTVCCTASRGAEYISFPSDRYNINKGIFQFNCVCVFCQDDEFLLIGQIRISPAAGCFSASLVFQCSILKHYQNSQMFFSCWERETVSCLAQISAFANLAYNTPS